jgi:outer membrane lipase/esterase
MKRSPREINLSGLFARKSSTWILLSALVLSLLLPTGRTWAGPYTKIVMFGDSLSDNGNLLALTNGGVPASPYFAGRFSNGPVWVERLASALDVPLVNYAVGGALTGNGNLFEAALGADFPGLLEEIARFVVLNPGGADPDAVYVVWAGANDFRSAPSAATIPVVIGNLVTAVVTLRTLGAQHIVVPNQPDLGRTPEGLSFGPAASQQLTALSQAFNQAFARALDDLGFDVIRVDVFAEQHRITKDPSEYGFTDVTTPCLTGLPPAVCVDPEAHLFWDRIHPTAAGHAILAEKVARAINQAILRQHNKQ